MPRDSPCHPRPRERGRASVAITAVICLVCLGLVVTLLVIPDQESTHPVSNRGAAPSSSSDTDDDARLATAEESDRTSFDGGTSPSPTENAGEDREEDIRWFRRVTDADVDISTMTGREFLAFYWGNEWPAMSAHLEQNLGEEVIYNHLRMWDHHQATTLGDIDVFIDQLPGLLRRNLADQNSRGRGIHLIVRKQAHLRPPFSHVNDAYSAIVEAVAASLERRMARHGTPWTQAEKREIAERIGERESVSILGAIEELDALGRELFEAVRTAVVNDLDTITRTERPRLGTLSVGPIMLTTPMGYENPGSPYVMLSANAHGLDGMDPLFNVWSAFYRLHIDQDPEVAARIESCRAARQRILEWLGAVIAVETGE